MAAFKLEKNKEIKPLMKGTQIQTNVSISNRYKKRLSRITEMMIDETIRNIDRLFKKGFVKDYFDDQDELDSTQSIEVMDAKSPSSEARIMLARIRLKYQKMMKQKGRDYAKDMLIQSNKDSLSRATFSLKKLSGGAINKLSITSPGIREELKAHLAWNVSLITNLTDDFYNKMTGIVTQSISSGGDFDINKAMLKVDGVTKRRARNIAEDQTRKAFNNLNEQRFKGAGINKFQWNHSGGSQHPREDHVKMDGNIYSFDDLPVIDERTGERGIPGQAPNCRCFMTPVIELNAAEQEELDNA